jgi:hypothetical protein
MRSMLLSKTPASLGCEVSCRAGCAAGQEFAERRQAIKPLTFARQMWRKRVGVEPKHSTPNSRRMMTLWLPPSSNWSQLESDRGHGSYVLDQSIGVRTYSVSVAKNTKQRIWKPRVRAEFERLQSGLQNGKPQ